MEKSMLKKIKSAKYSIFNSDKYITRAIESALAQTFSSIEFLVCDDCGTDSSIEIVKEYQTSHPRGKDIRIVHQPQNMGIGEARNKMMSEAHGKYFYSLDADDMISSNAITYLYTAAKKYNAQLVYGSYERIFVNGNQKRSHLKGLRDSDVSSSVVAF